MKDLQTLKNELKIALKNDMGWEQKYRAELIQTAREYFQDMKLNRFCDLDFSDDEAVFNEIILSGALGEANEELDPIKLDEDFFDNCLDESFYTSILGYYRNYKNCFNENTLKVMNEILDFYYNL